MVPYKYRRIKIIGLSVISILLLSVFILYSKLGLKEYISAVRTVSAIDDNDGKMQSFNELFEDDDFDYVSGIVGFTPKNGKFLFIWGKSGPKIVKLNGNIEYSSYQVCTFDNLRSFSGGNGFSIGRNLSRNYSEWMDLAETGAYISLVYDDTGQLSEVKTSDVWLFMPLDLTKICKGKL